MKKLEQRLIHSYTLSRCIPYGETICRTKGFTLVTFTQRIEFSDLIGCAISMH